MTALILGISRLYSWLARTGRISRSADKQHWSHVLMAWIYSMHLFPSFQLTEISSGLIYISLSTLLCTSYTCLSVPWTKRTTESTLCIPIAYDWVYLAHKTMQFETICTILKHSWTKKWKERSVQTNNRISVVMPENMIKPWFSRKREKNNTPGSIKLVTSCPWTHIEKRLKKYANFLPK